MLQTVMWPIDSSRMAWTAIFNDNIKPVPPAVPVALMTGQVMSWRLRAQRAGDLDFHVLCPALNQGLGGKDMFDFRGSDPVGKGTEGTMGRRWLSPQTTVIPGKVHPVHNDVGQCLAERRTPAQ
jgi:hypothetical protein